MVLTDFPIIDEMALEAVLKTLLELKSFVGTKCSILKILCVFLRLNTWSRLDFEPEKNF